MLKKILLVSLSAFTFLTLTGCGNEKKLTAEEAKTEMKAIQEGTANKLNEAKCFTFISKIEQKNTISAKNLKAKFALNPSIDNLKEKINAKNEININFDLKNFTGTASFDSKADVSISATSSGVSLDVSTKTKSDIDSYIVKGSDKLNTYLSFDQTISMDLPDMYKNYYKDGDYDTHEKYNLVYDYEDEDILFDEIINSAATNSYIEYIKNFDLSELVKDWSIFSKKGNSLILDFNNLDNYNLDSDFLTMFVGGILELGIKLNNSYLKINLGSNKEIKSIELKLKGKGDIEYSKLKDISSSTIDASAIFSSYTGTINFDMDYTYKTEFSYTTTSFTVPQELLNAKERDLSSFLDDYLDLDDLYRDLKNKKNKNNE